LFGQNRKHRCQNKRKEGSELTQLIGCMGCGRVVDVTDEVFRRLKLGIPTSTLPQELDPCCENFEPKWIVGDRVLDMEIGRGLRGDPSVVSVGDFRKKFPQDLSARGKHEVRRRPASILS